MRRLLFAAVLAVTLRVAPAAAGTAAELFGRVDPGERLPQLSRVLASADSPEHAAWIRRIDAAPACAARDEDRVLAVESWARVDPAAARAYVERFRAGPVRTQSVRQALVRGWTRADADAAWTWSREQPVTDGIDLAQSALTAVAENDVPRGMTWLRRDRDASADRTPTSPHAERVFVFFRALMELGDYASCRREAGNYPPGEVREQLVFFLADRMSEYRWPETAAWAKERPPGDERYAALVAVALRRVAQNWQEALEWAREGEEPALRVRLARAVAGETIARDPTFVMADRILAAIAAPAERHGAYAAFAGTAALVAADPKRVLAWAWEIADRESRIMALIRGYAQWRELSPDAAQTHLATAGEKRVEDRKTIEAYFAGGGQP